MKTLRRTTTGTLSLVALSSLLAAVPAFGQGTAGAAAGGTTSTSPTGVTAPAGGNATGTPGTATTASPGAAPGTSPAIAPPTIGTQPTPTGTTPNPGSPASTPGTGTTPQGGAGTAPGALPVTSGAPAILDLPTTIQLTVNASNALAVANRNIEKDIIAVDGAKALGRPQANVTAQETYLDRPIKLSFGQQTIVAQPQSTQDIHAQGSIPLDLTGQLKNGVSIYRLQVLADQFTRDQIYDALVLKAETAYFAVLRAQHQVSVAQSALSEASAQEDIANKLFNGGTGLKFDLLRAQTQVSQARKNLLQAQNMLALAQNNLNDSTGRPLSSAVSAVDVPGVTSGYPVVPTPVIAGTAPKQPAPAVVLPTVATYFEPPVAELNSIDLAKSIEDALVIRPELEAGLVNIEAAQRQVKLAHRTMEPSINLMLNAHDYPTTSFQNPYHNDESIVAMLTVPLTDGGLTRDNVMEAKITVENAKSTYQSTRTDVELQVRQAYLNLQNTAQQIDSANAALNQAVAARALAQVRYENGVGLYLEVTDAESALTAAETGQVNAVYDYLVARAQFENAVGRPNTHPAL